MSRNDGPRIIPDRCPQCGANLPVGGPQIICEYCGSRLIRYGGPPVDGPEGAAQPSSGGVISGVHFKPFSCVDAQGLGGEALSLLIPAGWEFHGGVQWNLARPGMPAVVAFQVYDPSGEAAFEVLPALSFYWTNNPMVQMTMPVGTPYYGNEVRPPASVVQVFQELVIPRYRGQYGGLRVLSIEPLPEFAQQVREATVVSSPMEQVRVEAAKARLHYQAGDQALEEDLRGVVKVHSTAMPVFMGSIEHIFWSADYLFAARAADGQLDGLADLFQTMISSLRLNPQWFMRYQQCQQALIRGEIQHIAQIGQVSRYISQVNNEISAMMTESYNRQQQIYDRVATSFSQAIRGVDEYYDPHQGSGVELPSGYSYAWSNALGEYFVSDDPNFDPNLYTNGTWEPLKRK